MKKEETMIRFRSYLKEDATMFGKMTRGEWMKYGNKRPDILKNAIKDGTPVSDVNGKDIKIPKTEENLLAIDDFINSKSPTFVLNLGGSKTLVSNQIGKSPLFGGKGQGAGATGTTANGESLQCLYLAAMIGEGVRKEFTHYTPELLKKYFREIDTDRTFEAMMGSDIAWHYSAYVSGKYLITKKYVNSSHVFHRGSKDMKEIYSLKRKAFKAEDKPILHDDKWNPGDIWAIKKGLKIKDVLDGSSITNLNASLTKAFLDRTIVAISLKQVNSLKKKAKHTDYNLDEVELGVHKYNKSTLKSERRGSDFWTSKGGYIYFDSNRRMDIRAPTSLGALNVEIQGKGARGGRAGYKSIEYAAKQYLKKSLMTNNELKAESKAMMKGRNETKAKAFWKKVNHIHKDVTWEDFNKGLQTATVDRIHANLGAVEVLYALDKATTKQSQEFVSYLVNMAGSKTTDSSVYVKIEAG